MKNLFNTKIFIAFNIMIMIITSSCSKINNQQLPGKLSNERVKSSSLKPRSCEVQPLNSRGGTESSKDNGNTWGNCENYVCENGYINIDNSCVLQNQTQSCIVSNGLGEESSTDGGKLGQIVLLQHVI